MTLEEVSKLQSEIFDSLQASYRNFYKKLEKDLESVNDEKVKLQVAIKDAEAVKSNALKIESNAEKKLAEANLRLEKAISEEFKAIEEQGKLTALISTHSKTDAALSAQREELIKREQAVGQAEKMVEMRQRKLKFERMKVDKIIEDAQITDELKKEMLDEQS